MQGRGGEGEEEREGETERKGEKGSDSSHKWIKHRGHGVNFAAFS